MIDSWYAERQLLRPIERLNKVYACPLKDNRQVDDRAGECGYQRVDSLEGSAEEVQQGKTLPIKAFPKGQRLKVFRLVLSPKRTAYSATNARTQHATQATQQGCALRWKIEQFHRETKQTTAREGCQWRLARSQPHPIACAILVWLRLKQVAQAAASTSYQLKQGLLVDPLRSQWRSPAIPMQLA